MKVITSTDIHTNVVRLVQDARHFLLLISPYIEPWDRLTTEVKRASLRDGLTVMLLVRGGEDAPKQVEKAKALVFPNVQLAHLNRLHAKIYMSESEIIVTSMNLLKSSALDSWEIALLFSNDEDTKQYNEIGAQAQALWTRALEERAGEEKLQRAAAASASGRPASRVAGGPAQRAAGVRPSATTPPSVPSKTVPTTPERAPAHAMPATPRVELAPEQQLIDKLGRLASSLAAVTATLGPAAPADRPGAARVGRVASASAGACIRCGVSVPKNPEKPLCPSCYKAWAKYENPSYEEKYCHSCGKAATTTLARPLCRACYVRS